MKTRLTKRQIKQYQDNGFIVIEDFLTPKELAHWRTATEEAVQQRLTERAASQIRTIPTPTTPKCSPSACGWRTSTPAWPS